MSTTTSPSQYAATAPTKDWTRGYARVAGIAYLVTFIASMPAIPLLGPLLNDPSYVLSGGADTQIAVGALLDVVNAVACIVTAVAVFPVVRRQNESLALGFVTSRLMEAAVIMIGVVSLLAVLTLHQDVAGTPGTDPASLQTTSQALVAVRDWTFTFGPNVCAGINALLFGTLLCRSRLVPAAHPHAGPLRCTHPSRRLRADRAGRRRAGLGVVHRRDPGSSLGALRRLLHGVQGLPSLTADRHRPLIVHRHRHRTPWEPA